MLIYQSLDCLLWKLLKASLGLWILNIELLLEELLLHCRLILVLHRILVLLNLGRGEALIWERPFVGL